ncbi:MAG TPA: cation transporter [Candidatus Udaeobacter sp.]|nr:cation transporter [Candidatus Udaeobacter sp.]
MCAHAVRVSLKSVSGVDSVEVSLTKGLAAVKMKPGNTATLKQLNDAIATNGFTMKDSTATVAGTVVITEGKATLRISGSNEVLQLAPESGVTVTSASGKTVVVEGTIPEGVKGKAPNSLRYHSMTEER